MWRSTTWLLAFALAACGGTSANGDAPPTPDDDAGAIDTGSIDTGSIDARVDARSDARPETSSDAGVEASSDTGAKSDSSSPTDASDATTSDATTTSGAELLADEAHRELTAMISSTYDHTTYVDESKGVFDYDCSGFVNYALSQVLPDALATLESATEARPLAEDYETFFAGIGATGKSGRWRSVARAMDLVPGDVVAWLEPADVDTGDTGHVMIVRDLPTPNAKDASEILVPITDSTSTPHGPADSRTASGATGLGTGTIGLLVDASGAPKQYHWTGGYSTKAETTSIALGHLE